MKKIFLFLTIILLSASLYTTADSAAAYAEENFKKFILLPVDESSKDKEFQKFINEFKKAVKEKNIKFIKENTSKNVSWSFGDEDGGINGFLKGYGLDNNSHKKSYFWDDMEKVLSLGGVYYKDEQPSFSFPYMFSKFPDDYDSYTFAAVTGKKVNVRKSADRNSPVIETLSYEIVKIINAPDYDTKEEIIETKRGVWVNIQTSSGNNGYIFSYYIHSPIGYRTIFEKQDGKWILTVFIAGD